MYKLIYNLYTQVQACIGKFQRTLTQWYAHIPAHIYIHTLIHFHYACVFVCIYWYIHKLIHTQVQACIEKFKSTLTSWHTDMRLANAASSVLEGPPYVYKRDSVAQGMCVYVCMYVYICVRKRWCGSRHVRVCMYVYICAQKRQCGSRYVDVCMYVYMHV